jgi:hypothetical protein
VEKHTTTGTKDGRGTSGTGSSIVCSFSRLIIADGHTRTTWNLHNGILTETREGAIIAAVHRFTFYLVLKKPKYCAEACKGPGVFGIIAKDIRPK